MADQVLIEYNAEKRCLRFGPLGKRTSANVSDIVSNGRPAAYWVAVGICQPAPDDLQRALRYLQERLDATIDTNSSFE